ncbi:MAG: VWA domain-containing protein [Saprospiraceae bacterium]|nr:VWA domain-containing protein [Saprospiraceae bacterium]
MLRFENPILLHLLWGLAFQALLLLVYWQWRQGKLRHLGSPQLAQRLLLGFSQRRFWFKNLLFAASLALLALAIANPVQAVQREGKSRESADVLIALDISTSMLAKDVLPSRIVQAKLFIEKLVQALEGQRIGLIFFAGDAYPQMPLSTDYNSLLLFVRNANPNFVTDQGTDMATAIDLAQRLFESNALAGRGLILLTDGENHQEDALQRAREAKASGGMVIHTVGVGTAGGATIPAANGGFQRDYTGQTIRTSLNQPFLRELAQAGGGISLSSNDPGAINALKTAIDQLQKTALAAHVQTEYISYFQWLLVPLLLFLTLEQLLWWRNKRKPGEELANFKTPKGPKNPAGTV